MSARHTKDYLKGGLSAFAANQAYTPISENFPIGADGGCRLVIGVQVTASTIAAAVTVKLQTSIDAGAASPTWTDAKTATVAGDGWTFIKLLAEVAGDQTYLPLGTTGRVLITTGAGDAATVANVRVVQDLR
jgi:hypothetical protein